MSVYFIDTSALAKRYTAEVGSRWIRGLTKASSGNVILISELALVEIFSLVARREQDKQISSASANRVRGLFTNHVGTEYGVISVNNTIIVEAQRLVTRHKGFRLRTLDSIQLACALQAQQFFTQSMIVVSADVKMLQSAQAEGFTTDDPNLHP